MTGLDDNEFRLDLQTSIFLCKGWGTTTSGGDTSNKLLEVNQDVVSTNTCKNVFDTQVKFTILKQNIGIWGFILFYCLKGSKMYSFKKI